MDEKRLKAELILKGMSMKEYARYLGINRATLYRKLRGSSSFTLSEIKKSRELFGSAVTESIFFAQ